MKNTSSDYEYAKSIAKPLFFDILKEQYPDYNVSYAPNELSKNGYDIVMVNKNDENDVFGFSVRTIPEKYRKDNVDKNCYTISEHSKNNSNPRRYYAFQDYDSNGNATGRFIIVNATTVNSNVGVSKTSTTTKKSYFISGGVLKTIDDVTIVI